MGSRPGGLGNRERERGLNDEATHLNAVSFELPRVLCEDLDTRPLERVRARDYG